LVSAHWRQSGAQHTASTAHQLEEKSTSLASKGWSWFWCHEISLTFTVDEFRLEEQHQSSLHLAIVASLFQTSKPSWLYRLNKKWH
jgi:hypothetical protein